MANHDLTIGVVTCRRPELLRTLLETLDAEEPTSQILVVDNDPEGSARPIVHGHTGPQSRVVRYVHEPQAGVAHARNRLLDECRTDWLASIDDDESPRPSWTRSLLRVAETTGAALVAGPVVSEFAEEPSAWIQASGIFERPRFTTGTRLPWIRGGNLLFDVERIRALGVRYDPRFNGGGEDVHFSVQVVMAGGGIVWCDDAIVDERVGAPRLTRRWVRQRWATTYCNHWRARVVAGESGLGDVVVRAIAKPISALGRLATTRSLVAAELEVAHARGAWRAVGSLLRDGHDR